MRYDSVAKLGATAASEERSVNTRSICKFDRLFVITSLHAGPSKPRGHLKSNTRPVARAIRLSELIREANRARTHVPVHTETHEYAGDVNIASKEGKKKEKERRKNARANLLKIAVARANHVA